VISWNALFQIRVAEQGPLGMVGTVHRWSSAVDGVLVLSHPPTNRVSVQ
jgi:hypothetical protein